MLWLAHGASWPMVTRERRRVLRREHASMGNKGNVMKRAKPWAILAVIAAVLFAMQTRRLSSAQEANNAIQLKPIESSSITMYGATNVKVLEINRDGTITWYKNGEKPIVVKNEKELTNALYDAFLRICNCPKCQRGI